MIQNQNKTLKKYVPLDKHAKKERPFFHRIDFFILNLSRQVRKLLQESNQNESIVSLSHCLSKECMEKIGRKKALEMIVENLVVERDQTGQKICFKELDILKDYLFGVFEWHITDPQTCPCFHLRPHKPVLFEKVVLFDITRTLEVLPIQSEDQSPLYFTLEVSPHPPEIDLELDVQTPSMSKNIISLEPKSFQSPPPISENDQPPEELEEESSTEEEDSDESETDSDEESVDFQEGPVEEPESETSEQQKKPKVLRRSNSTSSLYINDTIFLPNIRELMKCVTVKLRSLIEMGFARPNKVLFSDFEEKVALTKYNPNFDEIPLLREIYNFVNLLFKLIPASSPEPSIMSLVYIERLIAITNFTLCPCNWRHIFMSAFFLAIKVWEDKCIWNIDFIEIFPFLSLTEVNHLEKQLLILLQFNVTLSASEYAKFYFELREYSNHRDNFIQPLDEVGVQKLELHSATSSRRFFKKLQRSATLTSISISPLKSRGILS